VFFSRNGYGARCHQTRLFLRFGALRTEFNAGPGLPPVLHRVVQLWRDFEGSLSRCRASDLKRPLPGCEEPRPA
jgi:hypothetical protein